MQAVQKIKPVCPHRENKKDTGKNPVGCSSVFARFYSEIQLKTIFEGQMRTLGRWRNKKNDKNEGLFLNNTALFAIFSFLFISPPCLSLLRCNKD